MIKILEDSRSYEARTKSIVFEDCAFIEDVGHYELNEEVLKPSSCTKAV